MPARLVVDDLRVFLVSLGRIVAGRMLQLRDRVGRPHVLLAAHPECILAARIERVGEHGVIAERGHVHADRLFGDFEHADAFDIRRGAGEVLVDERTGQSDRLENLGARVRHIGGDAHLRHHFAQAFADRLDEILDRPVAGFPVIRPAVEQKERLHRKVRVNRLRAVTAKQREMVNFARGAGFHHQAGTGAQAFVGEVLVDCGQRKQRGNRDMLGIDPAIGDDDDRKARTHRILGLRGERSEARLDRFLAPRGGIANVQFARTELAVGIALDMADLLHLVEIEHGVRDFQADRRVHLVDAEQVWLRADERHQRSDELLADRVDRGIGHLRKQLLEVVIERLGLVRQDREGRIVAHRADRLFAVGGHRRHDELEVFLRVGEGLLPVEQRHRRALGLLLVRLHVIQADANALDPFAIRLGRGERVLQFLVIDDAAFLEIDEEHLARLKPPFLDDLFFRDGEASAFRAHDHEVIVGDDVARGPQAIPVECGADLAAIGERNRGWAVPRLHHRRVILVERAAARIHQRVPLPRLGDHHHDRVRDRVARHDQQFERVVERSRVGLAVVNKRPEFGEVLAENRRGNCALACADPVHIAAKRVDLAVVRDQAERVREVPRRERIGGKALVHQRQRRNAARILQVLVVRAYLAGQQHALVDNSACRHGGHVKLLAVQQL